jgi:hypothetical protein
VKVLFVMLHPGFIRYYDSAIRLLAASGHDVQLAFEVTRDKLGEDLTATRLAESSPRIRCEATPARGEGVSAFLTRADRSATRSGDMFRTVAPVSPELAWESLATTVRLMLDYVRYFEPAFTAAEGLRSRAGKRLPRLHEAVVRTVASSGSVPRRMLAAALRGIERLVPANPNVREFLRTHAPDVLLVTPLIELGSQQVDYVKAARQLGIPSVLCVASWDNLTSKGMIRVVPDRVIVWNEAQRQEAIALHGVPAERIDVTGAQLFDDWFTMQPSRSREAFCADVGLDPAKPFVLYVGSSIFIAPEEVPFAERWLSALRTADDEAVSGAGVLIRPHPANSRQWRAFDTDAFANVAIWPAIGTDPNAATFRRDFFDSLYYSAAVVGVNTSAQLEAGIVGRPVFTVRAPEFAHAQEGTLHFQHLVNRESGGVLSADRLDGHLDQLAAVLRQGSNVEAQRRFIGEFVRPHGIDKPATPLFVEAVERIGQAPRPEPVEDGTMIRVARPGAAVLARLARVLAEDRPIWTYMLRPCVFAGVWMAAPWYWMREGGTDAIRLSVKRTRRSVQRAAYESSRTIGRQVARIRKTARRRVVSVGGSAKRMIGFTRGPSA